MVIHSPHSYLISLTLLTQAAAQVEAERREAVAQAERERVEQAALAAARIALDREQRASVASVERLAAEAAAAEAAAEMAEFNYLQMLDAQKKETAPQTNDGKKELKEKMVSLENASATQLTKLKWFGLANSALMLGFFMSFFGLLFRSKMSVAGSTRVSIAHSTSWMLVGSISSSTTTT